MISLIVAWHSTEWHWLNCFLCQAHFNRTTTQRTWWGCPAAVANNYAGSALDNACNRSAPDARWDVEPTVRYTMAAVAMVLRDFAGDPDRVLVTGHSRGAVAVNFVGLYNDNIAKLWTAFAPASHYDGVAQSFFLLGILMCVRLHACVRGGIVCVVGG